MKKRSVIVNGHATSVSMEEEFWDALKAIAHDDNISLNKLISQIDENRTHSNLSSSLRVFILHRLKN